METTGAKGDFKANLVFASIDEISTPTIEDPVIQTIPCSMTVSSCIAFSVMARIWHIGECLDRGEVLLGRGPDEQNQWHRQKH